MYFLVVLLLFFTFVLWFFHSVSRNSFFLKTWCGRVREQREWSRRTKEINYCGHSHCWCLEGESSRCARNSLHEVNYTQRTCNSPLLLSLALSIPCIFLLGYGWEQKRRLRSPHRIRVVWVGEVGGENVVLWALVHRNSPQLLLLSCQCSVLVVRCSMQTRPANQLETCKQKHTTIVNGKW